MMEKGDFFVGHDRYIFYDFEEALFGYDHITGTVVMKFVGDDFENEVPHDHRIFNEAILRGIEITEPEYRVGQITVSRVKLAS